MRLIFLIGILIVLSVSPTTVSSTGQRPGLAGARGSGVTLRVRTAGTTYPRDALVRVTVTLQNTSRHEVRISYPGTTFNGYQSPQIEVMNLRGVVVYPPALSAVLLALPGRVPSVGCLPAGQTLTWRIFVILRGSRLRATIMVQGPHDTQPVELKTPPIQVHLRAVHAPHIILSKENHAVTVQTLNHPHGPLLYLDSAECRSTEGPDQYPEHLVWTPVAGRRIVAQSAGMPECTELVQWHLVAGWENQPVAVLDYRPQ